MYDRCGKLRQQVRATQTGDHSPAGRSFLLNRYDVYGYQGPFYSAPRVKLRLVITMMESIISANLKARDCMTLSRFIELCSCFLLAALVFTVISAWTLRPSLGEARQEAKAAWDSYVQAVRERNEQLPGLVEAVKGFEPGHATFMERLMEARSISLRATSQDTLIATVDDMERNLVQILQISRKRPELRRYPPFMVHWERVVQSSRRVAASRRSYYTAARIHNRLLTPFPQRLLTALFGFTPLKEYPLVGTVGEPEG